MLLSIVTLNYNKLQLTLECIDSLYSNFEKEFVNNDMELVLVDNGSESESLKNLKDKIKEKAYKNITLIVNKENLGFSKGCNIGTKVSKGDLLLMLNNDTIVEDRGILNMAKYLANHSEISILGGQVTNTDGTKQPSVGKFYTPIQAFLLLLGLEKFGVVGNNPNIITRVDWVKGSLLMVKKEVFEKLRGFDENIFMYIEDMEFCYRAKLSGFKTYFYPDVSVTHKDQGSSSRSFAIVNIYENLLYFYKKHRSRTEYLFLKSLLRTKAFFLLGIGKISGNSYLITTYEKALRVA